MSHPGVVLARLQAKAKLEARAKETQLLARIEQLEIEVIHLRRWQATIKEREGAGNR